MTRLCRPAQHQNQLTKNNGDGFTTILDARVDDVDVAVAVESHGPWNAHWCAAQNSMVSDMKALGILARRACGLSPRGTAPRIWNSDAWLGNFTTASARCLLQLV